MVPQGVRDDIAASATPEPELRARLGLGSGPVVLCVAQKRRHKNLEALVRALALLERDDVRLVIPGRPTAYEFELRELHSRARGGRSRAPARLGREEALEGLYRAAACFALPSLMEGFGLPILEAMARELPVACSNRSALSEVAGDAAALFDPEDPAAIAAAVGRILGDPGVRGGSARGGTRALPSLHLGAHGAGDRRQLPPRARGASLTGNGPADAPGDRLAAGIPDPTDILDTASAGPRAIRGGMVRRSASGRESPWPPRRPPCSPATSGWWTSGATPR